MSITEHKIKKTKSTILVIDDQDDILLTAKMLLKKYFETIFTVNNPKHILKILTKNTIDVVLLDMNYRIGFEDGREGIYLLKEIKTLSPHTSVILMTAFGKVETAVEGLKTGATDYILKPWDNEKLVSVVKLAVKESRKKAKRSGDAPKEVDVFIGNSLAIKKAYSLADKVAKTNANVLILGENGTGKSIMAKYIHKQSNRKEQPFITVDLGSLNENLFESELFGYVKGAFTDAKSDSFGRFEAAQNGTIFLDEIGNVPIHLQSKLLQVIQTKTVTRLGEVKYRPIDVRIIAATNMDLKKEVVSKNFREDLYYRINTMEIIVPPIREQTEDIISLAQFFLNKMIVKYDKNEIIFEKEAKKHIKKYTWPGNVRELGNRIERAVILCENNQITVADLDLDKVLLSNKHNEEPLLDALEKSTIKKVLVKNNFNISRAATELKLSRASLYRRMEKYGIESN